MLDDLPTCVLGRKIQQERAEIDGEMFSFLADFFVLVRVRVTKHSNVDKRLIFFDVSEKYEICYISFVYVLKVFLQCCSSS